MAESGRKRAVGYVRVSTAFQADEGISLEAQEARIRAWCLGQGHDLGPDDIHVDAGLSGGRADNRPALRRALDAVCERRGVLVVYSLSRLARSVRDTLQIAERLDKAGADLASLSESIDTTSAAGRMLFRMLAVLAEFEKDLVAERTRGALQHKRAKGERVGGIPYGKRLAEDGRTLEVDAEERVVLEEMRAMRAGGLGLRAIARALNDRGIRAKGGGAWTHPAVTKILAAPNLPTKEAS